MRFKLTFLLALFAVYARGADVSGVTVSPPGSGNLKAASVTASNLTTLNIIGTDSQKKLVSSTATVAELNAIHGVPLASAASVVSLALTVGGKQDGFVTGVGVTNIGGVLSLNVSPGANITFSTNSNGQLVISSSGVGGGGGPISDGNYGDVTVSGAGTIFTINNNVIGNSKLAQMAQGTVKLRPSTAGLGDPTDGAALPWADTGDVSRPADSKVTTIANGAVTLAKQANMATASIVGRNTAGSGAPEVLSTLPTAVQDNITRLGTVTSGTLSYSLLPTRTLTAGAGLSGGGDLSADRTITLDMSTFAGNLTIWDAAQASRTITYNLSGATDPVWTIGNNSVDLTTGVLKAGGNQVATLNGTEVLANKTMTTPVLGVATATSINGTAIPSTVTLTKTTDNLSVFAGTTSAQLRGVLSDESGTGPALFQGGDIGVATGTSLVLSGDLTAQTLNLGGTVKTNSSITLWGSTDGTGFTITNNANGNYRLSLPASGLSGAYNLSFSGTSVVFAAASATGLASTDIDTSAELRAILGDESGTGALLFAGGALGAATATSINGLTITTSSGTFTVANGKTFTVNNTVTFSGTDSTTMTLPGTSQSLVGQTDTATLQNKTSATTAAGGNNTLKTRKLLVLQVDRASGTSATMATSDSTANGFGRVTFAGNTAATNSNFIEFSTTVPPWFDNSQDLKVEYLQFKTAGTQTGAVTWDIGMADIADSASADSPAFTNYKAMTSGTLTSAAGDVFTISAQTLAATVGGTTWRSALTAGHRIKIRMDRNDTNTDAMELLEVMISYVDTQ